MRKNRILLLVLLLATSIMSVQCGNKKEVQDMIRVEAGSFFIGDTWGDGKDIERPSHEVAIDYDFLIGMHEVTFEKFDAFCEATGRDKPYDQDWGRGSRPVVNVSWWDAIAYCNWRSEKENLPKAYDEQGSLLDKDGNITLNPAEVVGFRLPTEAEWEYAARGGSKSKGYKYSGSDNSDEVAWYAYKSGWKTEEVGKKTANELGIFDMSGNALEWCSDYYAPYTSETKTNPYTGEGSHRILRGGSWMSNETAVRVSNRDYQSAGYTLYIIGFRIARTAE